MNDNEQLLDMVSEEMVDEALSTEKENQLANLEKAINLGIKVS
jgi:hypothetical protein